MLAVLNDLLNDLFITQPFFLSYNTIIEVSGSKREGNGSPFFSQEIYGKTGIFLDIKVCIFYKFIKFTKWSTDF